MHETELPATTALTALIRRVWALLTVAVCLLAAPQAALAQTQEVVTATGTAEVIIVERLSLTKVDDLRFGRIIPGPTAGTVVLAPSGARTATGGTRLATGTSQPASFAGYGRRNQLVALSVGSLSSTLTRSGGTQTMSIDSFVIGSTPTALLTTAPLAFRITSTNGMFYFPVGATLRVKANQTPGIYNGSFAVTINYM